MSSAQANPRVSLILVALMAAAVVRVHAAGPDWKEGLGFRSAPVTLPASGKAGFSLLESTLSGIHFRNVLSEQRHLTNQILLNGSGVAAGDVDGDGLCDLYFCGLGVPNALYRNLGNWKFEEVIQRTGAALAELYSTGVALSDLDGDSDLDLAVNTVGGGTHIFGNDGHGQFKPIARLNEGKGGMSLALADIDGDGFLDIYVTNYRTSALMDMPNARAWFKVVSGKTIVERVDGRYTTEPDLTNRFVVNARGGVSELGEADLLIRNRGGTNFVGTQLAAGVFLDQAGSPMKQPLFEWGLSAMFRDLNADGRPDLYVCNDFDSEDRIWLNTGSGKFQALPQPALRKTSWFSMGIDFADINRDGFDDFIVLDMLSRDHRQRMTQIVDPASPDFSGGIDNRPQCGLNTLFLNRGDGTYAEIAQLSGLDATEWSWAPVFIDVDLDGWEDLLVSNGQERAARDSDVTEQLRKMRNARKMSDAEIFQARKTFPRLDTANLAFRNRGDLTFEEVGAQWGFNHRGVSHGMALADLDNDGDLDVVVNNFNDAPSLYRNESNAPRVAVRLRGPGPNTHGIGAKIRVSGGAVPPQSQEFIAGGRYLSSDDAIRAFAAASPTNQMRIEISWPNGKQSVVANALANHLYEIDEARSTDHGPRTTDNVARPAFFEDVSHLVQHAHIDEPYDDFTRQPLLPNRLSELGPGVAWCDLDNDGWDDLIVASGKSGHVTVFRNETQGGFKLMRDAPFHLPVTRDLTTLLGWRRSNGLVLLAGSSNYEDGLSVGASVRQFNVTQKSVDDTLPGDPSGTGPMSLADIDGDGDLDLFVGGRSIPGRYPEPASSRMFLSQGGKLQLDVGNSRTLEKTGLVSGSVFADLDSDGDPDLALACEWGPVKIYRNDRGLLTDVTAAFGMADFTGWWNGVAAGDFDGDGRMDLAASNWGRNSKYERHRNRPLRILSGDLNGDGSIEVIEAHFDSGMSKYVPERQLAAMLQAMPGLGERFPTHRAYADAGVDDVIGNQPRLTTTRDARWLESTVFLNRGNRFEPRVLPVEAQMAPAFGVCVGDFDNDGHEDIFLSQNFFAVAADTSRYDAGRGLWLRGNGHGEFEAPRGAGVAIYGEQRGCAAADFDRDGRLDLAVAQNAAAVKLFRNRRAKPGLRVRLKGGPENPHAVGAVLRLITKSKTSPARELHAGSGYWSQDSAVQVLALPDMTAQIWIRWPGGKITESGIPPGARELVIDENTPDQ